MSFVVTNSAVLGNSRQADNSAAPSTVTQVAEAKVVFVQYNDERGRPQTAMFFKVGDNYVTTKDTADWCRSLRPMTNWMRKQLESKLAEQSTPAVPAEDTVKVL